MSYNKVLNNSVKYQKIKQLMRNHSSKFVSFFCLVALITISGSITSQVYNLDSLYNNIRQKEELDSNYYLELDTLKYAIEEYRQHHSVDQLSIDAKQIWAKHYSGKQPLKSIIAFEESIKESEEISYQYGIASGNHEIGMVYYRQGLYESAIQKFQYSSSKFAQIEKWWEYGFSLIDIGNIYYRQRILKNAQYYYNEALKVFTNHNIEGQFEIAAAVCNNNLGLVFYVEEKYDTALYYFEQGYTLRKKMELKAYYGHSLRYIAACLDKLNNADSALLIYKKALESDMKFGPKIELINSYMDLGDFYFSINKTDESQKAYYQAYTIALNHQLYPKTVEAANELAQSYNAIQKIDSAEKYYKIAFDFADKYGQMNGKLAAAEKLADLFEKKGNAFQQNYYLKAIINTEKTINDGKISQHQLEYELNQRVYDNKLYETKNAQKIILITGISAIAIMLLIAMLFIYRSKKRYVLLNSKLLEQKQKLSIQTKELENANIHLIDNNEEIAQQREEIKAQAESLAESLKKLRDLNEFKEGLMAMIVHDLKNPLNTIINQSKNVLVSESATQMLNMVNNILDLQKYENVQMPTKKENCNLDTIIENALFNTRYLTEEKNISIKSNISHEYQVFTDPELTERICTNLVTNAIKYSPLNGIIIIDAKPNENSTLKVSVIDNGPGITDNVKHLVFEKYTQLISRNSGHARPTGLGLTFCKMAVEALGGEIGLETEVGKGTSFWFTIQLVSEFQRDIKEIEIQPAEIESFTKEALILLKPFIAQLKVLQVYEISDIQKILNEIKTLDIKGTESWIKALENSVYSVNESEFFKLLDIMT